MGLGGLLVLVSLSVGVCRNFREVSFRSLSKCGGLGRREERLTNSPRRIWRIMEEGMGWPHADGGVSMSSDSLAEDEVHRGDGPSLSYIEA